MEINFAGQYTKKELLEAQKLHELPSTPMLIFRIAAIAAAIFFYIGHFFLSPPESLVEELGVLLPVVIIILLMARPFFNPYEAVNKAMKDADFSGSISGSADNTGITLTTTHSTSTLKWSLFQRVKQKGDFLMLYQDKNWYTLFPRRFFSTDTDWNSFQGLVKQHLPG